MHDSSDWAAEARHKIMEMLRNAWSGLRHHCIVSATAWTSGNALVSQTRPIIVWRIAMNMSMASPAQQLQLRMSR